MTGKASAGSAALRHVRTRDGIALAVYVDGPPDAPPLVLSHSLGMTAAMWDGQVAALARRFRVIRSDTRGHGGSEVSPGAYGVDMLAADVLDLLDHLGCERASFCGLSMGGMIGQRLAVVAPDRLDRLVLANTSAFMGPRSAWQARTEVVLAQGMASVTEDVLARWFTPEFRASSPEVVERARATLLATAPQGYAGCCAAIRDMDQRATARLIAAPTLVIAGARDPATPPDHARFLAQQIAGARYVELDAAHLSNLEAPERFAAALDAWLG